MFLTELFSHLFSNIVLTVTGWQPLRPNTISQGRHVLVYPHTTRFDYLLVLLLKQAYPDAFGSKMHIVMSERYSWLIPAKNIVSAPDPYVRWYTSRGYSYSGALARCWLKSIFRMKLERDEIRSNFVSEIVESFKDKDNFCILISPTGSVDLTASWRSGFWHIARGLNANVLVGGLDYVDKVARVTEPQILSDEYMDDWHRLNRVFHTFKGYGTKCSSLVDYPTFSSFLATFIVVPRVLEISPHIGMWTMIMSIVSFYYHYTREERLCVLDMLGSSVAFVSLGWLIHSHGMEISLWSYALMCGAFFFLGRSWHNNRPRCNNYHITHSLFHILAAAGIYTLIPYALTHVN